MRKEVWLSVGIFVIGLVLVGLIAVNDEQVSLSPDMLMGQGGGEEPARKVYGEENLYYNDNRFGTGKKICDSLIGTWSCQSVKVKTANGWMPIESEDGMGEITCFEPFPGDPWAIFNFKVYAAECIEGESMGGGEEEDTGGSQLNTGSCPTQPRTPQEACKADEWTDGTELIIKGEIKETSAGCECIEHVEDARPNNGCFPSCNHIDGEVCKMGDSELCIEITSEDIWLKRAVCVCPDIEELFIQNEGLIFHEDMIELNSFFGRYRITDCGEIDEECGPGPSTEIYEASVYHQTATSCSFYASKCGYDDVDDDWEMLEVPRCVQTRNSPVQYRVNFVDQPTSNSNLVCENGKYRTKGECVNDWDCVDILSRSHRDCVFCDSEDRVCKTMEHHDCSIGSSWGWLPFVEDSIDGQCNGLGKCIPKEEIAGCSMEQRNQCFQTRLVVFDDPEIDW